MHGVDVIEGTGAQCRGSHDVRAGVLKVRGQQAADRPLVGVNDGEAAGAWGPFLGKTERLDLVTAPSGFRR